MAIDINNVQLTDLISVETLQRIQDAFADATGMAALTTDMNGSVTHLSNPTHFCMNLTRTSRVGGERCNLCDLKGGADAAKNGRPSVYYCHGGLVDFAAPIMVGGRHIGSLIGGQVLPEPPDENKFRKIAREIGVDEEEYIKAIRKIKIMPKEQIDKAANLLFEVASSLSEAGYQRLAVSEAGSTMQQAVSDLIAEADEINNVMTNVAKDIEELKKTFETFNETLEQSASSLKGLDKMVTYIKDISMQLTLLGFNASVEARKSGSHGAGFGAIAQEIRRLSAETSTQTQRIDSMLEDINRSSDETLADFKSTGEVLQNSIDSVNSLESISKKIVELVEGLKDRTSM